MYTRSSKSAHQAANFGLLGNSWESFSFGPGVNKCAPHLKPSAQKNNSEIMAAIQGAAQAITAAESRGADASELRAELEHVFGQYKKEFDSKVNMGWCPLDQGYPDLVKKLISRANDVNQRAAKLPGTTAQPTPTQPYPTPPQQVSQILNTVNSTPSSVGPVPMAPPQTSSGSGLMAVMMIGALAAAGVGLWYFLS